MEQLRCTTAGLAYLAGLLGCESFIGLPDPFPGWLAAEIDEALEGVREALAARGLILRADGRVAPEVTELLRPCIRPSAVLSIGQAGELEHIFLGTGVPAVHLQASTNGVCDLRTVADVPAFVLERCAFGGPGPTPTLPGSCIPEALLRQAAAAPDQAAGLLAQAGLASESATALAADLTAPARNLSLLLTRATHDTWTTTGFGLLAGASYTWLLRPASGGQTLVQPVGPADLVRAVTQLLTAESLVA